MQWLAFSKELALEEAMNL